jgi:hypothetical protein
MPTRKKAKPDPRAKLTKAQRRAQAPPDVDEEAFREVIQRLVTTPPTKRPE